MPKSFWERKHYNYYADVCVVASLTTLVILKTHNTDTMNKLKPL